MDMNTQTVCQMLEQSGKLNQMVTVSIYNDSIVPNEWQVMKSPDILPLKCEVDHVNQ